MSEIDPSQEAVANHTLAFLRRLDRRLDELDKRFVQMVDVLSRQQTRLERIERGVNEVKYDMGVMENALLNRMTDQHFLASRVNDMDERLMALEQASRSTTQHQ